MNTAGILFVFVCIHIHIHGFCFHDLAYHTDAMHSRVSKVHIAESHIHASIYPCFNKQAHAHTHTHIQVVKELDDVVARQEGKLSHVDLVLMLGIADWERGSQTAGNSYSCVLYTATPIYIRAI
jgi:hypothetical protein